MYERDSLAHDTTVKEKNIDYLQDNMKFSEFSLAGEVARYLNISCIFAARILRESVDGINTVLEAVNRYNAVLDPQWGQPYNAPPKAGSPQIIILSTFSMTESRGCRI